MAPFLWKPGWWCFFSRARHSFAWPCHRTSLFSLNGQDAPVHKGEIDGSEILYSVLSKCFWKLIFLKMRGKTQKSPFNRFLWSRKLKKRPSENILLTKRNEQNNLWSFGLWKQDTYICLCPLLLSNRKVEEKDMTGRQFSQVQQAMIEEEKWAAPSMTYFRPHFMVGAAIISINVVAITLLIIIIVITRCLPLVMAMQGHMIPRLWPTASSTATQIRFKCLSIRIIRIAH